MSSNSECLTSGTNVLALKQLVPFLKKSLLHLFYFFVIGLLLYFFSIETSLVLQQSSSQDLLAASPDEASILGATTVWHFASGYGPVFWGTLSALKWLVPDGNEVAFLRFVFILFKYLAWGILFAYFYAKHSKLIAFSMLFFLISTPGYLFFGKVISPEYLLILLSSLAVIFLFRDRYELSKNYYISLIFASLAAATKVTAFPLLVAVLAYAFLTLIFKNQYTTHRNTVSIAVSFIILTTVWLPIFYFSGLDNTFRNIAEIMAIAPPAQLSGQFDLAWYRDVITWDRIFFGGLKVDFLTTVVLCLYTVIGMLFMKRTRRSISLVISVVLIAAIILFLSVFFKGMAAAWYLFLPVLLCAITGYEILAESDDKNSLLFITVILITLFVFSGWQRMEQRISLKHENNSQLVNNEITMPEVISYVAEELPCAESANLDILVPAVKSDLELILAKDALYQQARGIWTRPGILVVNDSLYQNHQSSLVNMIVEGDMSHYIFLTKIGGLLVFSENSLSCFVSHNN